MRFPILALLTLILFPVMEAALVLNGPFGSDVPVVVLAMLFVAMAVAAMLWVAALVYLALWMAEFLSSWRSLRASKRELAGLCGRCGYDLRASAGNCPECGLPIWRRRDAATGAVIASAAKQHAL